MASHETIDVTVEDGAATILLNRPDALNAWNHPRFSGPNTSVTSTSFGIVSGQSNAPRQVQMGLKLSW